MAAGLRERKKQKTRQAIQRAALRLFMKQGYEATTVEDIAAAAEVSPSTFFNYFPSKEDVVLYDMYDPMAIELILKRPSNEPLATVARRVIEELGRTFESDKEMILSRGRLLMDVPELRSRMWDELERSQALFVEVIARRTGRKADDFDLRVLTRSFVGGIYEAVMEWFRSDGRENLVALVERALDAMEQAGQLTSAG